MTFTFIVFYPEDNRALTINIPNTSTSFLHEKLVVTQRLMKNPAVTEPEISPPCSQQPNTDTYLEPGESRSQPLILCKNHLNIIFLSRPSCLEKFFPFTFRVNYF